MRQGTPTISQWTNGRLGGGDIPHWYLFSFHSQNEDGISMPNGSQAQSHVQLWAMKCDINEMTEALLAGLVFAGLTFPSATVTCMLQRDFPDCQTTRRE